MNCLSQPLSKTETTKMRSHTSVSQYALFTSLFAIGMAGCGAAPEGDAESLGQTEQAWASVVEEDHGTMTYDAVKNASQRYALAVLHAPASDVLWQCTTSGVSITGHTTYSGNLCEANQGTDEVREYNPSIHMPFMQMLYPKDPKSQNLHAMRDTSPAPSVVHAPYQSVYEACKATVANIQTAADKAASYAFAGSQSGFNIAAGIGAHTLQDSFAPGHAIRYDYGHFKDMCVCNTCDVPSACRHPGSSLIDPKNEGSIDSPANMGAYARQATVEYLNAIVDRVWKRDETAVPKMLAHWFQCDGNPGYAKPTAPLGFQMTTKMGTFQNGSWRLDLNGNGKWDGCSADRCIDGFGIAGDQPLVGMWAGIYTITYPVIGNVRLFSPPAIGVYRPGNKVFYLDQNGNGR
jgi:hypothetical protein